MGDVGGGGQVAKLKSQTNQQQRKKGPKVPHLIRFDLIPGVETGWQAEISNRSAISEDVKPIRRKRKERTHRSPSTGY